MTEPKYDVKKLKELFKEWSDAEINIEGAKDLQGSVSETANEKLGMSKAEFTALAKLHHQMKYHSEKFEKAKEKAEYVGIVENL